MHLPRWWHTQITVHALTIIPSALTTSSTCMVGQMKSSSVRWWHKYVDDDARWWWRWSLARWWHEDDADDDEVVIGRMMARRCHPSSNNIWSHRRPDDGTMMPTMMKSLSAGWWHNDAGRVLSIYEVVIGQMMARLGEASKQGWSWHKEVFMSGCSFLVQKISLNPMFRCMRSLCKDLDFSVKFSKKPYLWCHSKYVWF